AEARMLQDLSRAGKRLMGFCRTNLFKRLESSGQSFVLSIERHILRNYIFLHAIDNREPLPIGTQDAALLDTRTYDEDADEPLDEGLLDDDGGSSEDVSQLSATRLRTEEHFRHRAADIYS